LRIADDKIKALLSKQETQLNSEALRIDSLESQIKSKLEINEFK